MWERSIHLFHLVSIGDCCSRDRGKDCFNKKKQETECNNLFFKEETNRDILLLYFDVKLRHLFDVLAEMRLKGFEMVKKYKDNV